MEWAHADACHLAVYDSRLGRTEERAGDALLAVWPCQNSSFEQKDLDIVRLARGLSGLCSHFSPVSQHFSSPFPGA